MCFRWSPFMIDYISAYKPQMAFMGLDFESDKPSRDALPKQMLFKPILDFDNKSKERTKNFNNSLKDKVNEFIFIKLLQFSLLIYQKENSFRGKF